MDVDVAPRCERKCAHGSRCVLPADHDPPDRHETEHGCVCYDDRPPELETRMERRG